jgi:hypothetical protein
LSVNQLSVFLSATLIFFLADMDTGAEFFPHAPTNALAAESGADHFYSWLTRSRALTCPCLCWLLGSSVQKSGIFGGVISLSDQTSL